MPSIMSWHGVTAGRTYVQDDADRKGLSRSDLVISYYGGRVDVEASEVLTGVGWSP